MEISNGIEMLGFTLWFREEKIIVLSDLQLGYEQTMNNAGIFLPRGNFDGIKDMLEKDVFPKTGKLDKIIINGDLKHDFGKISEQESSEVYRMIDFLKKNCKELILVKGNHDTILKPISDLKGVKMPDEFFLEKSKTLILHGHKEPTHENLKKAKRVIIGHEHPCVSISDGVKTETYKCFLRGKYYGKELIVLPSFNMLSLGTDVMREEIMSPLIKNLREFEVFAVEDKPYYMGKINDL